MRYPIFATVPSLALLALAPALHAQSIGASFSDSNANTVLAATDSAGVPAYAQTHFNKIVNPATNLTLNDNTGNATTARLTGGSIFTRTATGSVAGPDEVLNNGVTLTTASITFTLSNIPYAVYTLLVYDFGGSPGSVQSVTAGALTFYTSSPLYNAAGYIDNNAATPFTYTQGIGLTAGTATANADYALFPALTGSTLNFTVTNTDVRAFAFTNGFQIINAVPEPSTYALALVGSLGLLGLGQRFRRTARRA